MVIFEEDVPFMRDALKLLLQEVEEWQQRFMQPGVRWDQIEKMFDGRLSPEQLRDKNSKDHDVIEHYRVLRARLGALVDKFDLGIGDIEIDETEGALLEKLLSGFLTMIINKMSHIMYLCRKDGFASLCRQEEVVQGLKKISIIGAARGCLTMQTTSIWEVFGETPGQFT